MTTIARHLAQWSRALRYESLPPEAVLMAKKCLLDQLGVQIKGSTLAHVQPSLGLVRDMACKPESSIVGTGEKTTAAYAAFVNGTFGHSCEFDDSHYDANHPGAVIIPASLAIGERDRLDGKALIRAMVAGYEVMTIAGGPIHRGMVKKGWHPLKVQGVFGVAAAVGLLLGLDEDQVTNAIAISASEASGTMEYDRSGGEVKRVHAGAASRSGMQAALLAAKGLTGPETVIEGKKGLFELFNDGSPYDTDKYLKADRLAILNTMFKLYPAVGTVHAALDALRVLLDELKPAPEEIASIRVGMADWAIHHGAQITRPKDFVGAQFSLAYSIGLRVIHGSNDLGLYLDPTTWIDPRVLAVADTVTPFPITFAPGQNELGATVELRLTDGRSAERGQPAFKGHTENPASYDDIVDKFRELVKGHLPDAVAEALVRKVATLEDVGDVTEIVDLACNRGGR